MKSSVFLRTFRWFLNLGWVEILDQNILNIVVLGLVVFLDKDLDMYDEWMIIIHYAFPCKFLVDGFPIL